MTTVLAWIRSEPVLVGEAAKALLAVAVSFGLPLTAEQKIAIIAAIYAGLSLVVRSKVSPQ